MTEKIKVISKVGGTVHPKYGRLEKGAELTIDKSDLAQQLFRPAKEKTEKKPAPEGAKKKKEA